MENPLDMSLDDLIKKNKPQSGAAGFGSGSGRDRGRSNGVGGGGPGPVRRFGGRGPARPAPYSVPKAPEAVWQQDLYAAQMAAAMNLAVGSGIETGTKLYISNLDYGVSNEDIKELFSEVGELKRYSINYDRSGRSKGTAEVVFARRADAVAAVKRYNNVQLDGKPMKLEMIGTSLEAPIPAPFGFNAMPAKFNPPRSMPTNGGQVGWVRGVGFGVRGRGGRGGRGQGRGGRGGGNNYNSNVTTEDLDKELDKYHADALKAK